MVLVCHYVVKSLFIRLYVYGALDHVHSLNLNNVCNHGPMCVSEIMRFLFVQMSVTRCLSVFGSV